MRRGELSFHAVGAGRGGTSLLAGLLDHHPEIEMGFERCAWTLHHGLRQQGNPDSLGRFSPARLAVRLGRLRSARARARAYIAACRKIASGFPERFWGNKLTTEHLRWLDAVEPSRGDTEATLRDFFVGQLAGAPVIFILRDGRACARSKVERTGMPWHEASRRWLYSVRCYRYMRDSHPRALCLRFEELLVEPEAQLRSICGFLEVAYDRAMLGGTTSEKMRPEYRRQGFDPTRAGVSGVPDAVISELLPALNELGYV